MLVYQKACSTGRGSAAELGVRVKTRPSEAGDRTSPSLVSSVFCLHPYPSTFPCLRDLTPKETIQSSKGANLNGPSGVFLDTLLVLYKLTILPKFSFFECQIFYFIAGTRALAKLSKANTSDGSQALPRASSLLSSTVERTNEARLAQLGIVLPGTWALCFTGITGKTLQPGLSLRLHHPQAAALIHSTDLRGF